MQKFFKTLTISIMCVGFSSTVQAGTSSQSSAKTVKATMSVKAANAKKVVRKVKRLSTIRKAATHTSGDVVFYKTELSRSKVIRKKAAKTRTPNLFEE